MVEDVLVRTNHKRHERLFRVGEKVSVAARIETSSVALPTRSRMALKLRSLSLHHFASKTRIEEFLPKPENVAFRSILTSAGGECCTQLGARHQRRMPIVRRGAWGGRTVARRTLGANHVTFVPEMGGPFRSHGPKPRGSQGDRRHAGVDGSLNSGFLYFSLPHARPRESDSSFSDPPCRGRPSRSLLGP